MFSHLLRTLPGGVFSHLLRTLPGDAWKEVRQTLIPELAHILTEGGVNPSSSGDSCETGRIRTGQPGGDWCSDCRKSVFSDAHRLFIFWSHPQDLYIPDDDNFGGEEWRPSQERPNIPGDDGPNRVAYWRNGKPTVQVHEGPDAGQWDVCSIYVEAREGLPYCMWVCKQQGPENPCDSDFMKEIST